MKEHAVTTKSNFVHFGIVIFLAVYLSILGHKVITKPTPFISWDESIYLEVGKEMIAQHSPVTLWQGSAWLEKPPLAPLFYGSIERFIPGNPEITTRLASVFLTGVALFLVYLLIFKAQKSALLALMVVITTAANPIVLQRAQIINTDVFLLIGWVGYFLTFRKFWPSLFFLFVGVFSKSVLGFYPLLLVFVYELYEFIVKKDKALFVLRIKELSTQIGAMSIWYILMIMAYKGEFIQVHFFEHLVARYTKSIETHFGHFSFYIDLIFIQYGNLAYLAAAGFIILTVLFLKKKVSSLYYFLSLALLPWFLFIIFAKTKLDWYIYPAIPEVLFLIIFPVTLLRKFPTIYAVVMVVLIINFIGNNYELKRSIFTTSYSAYDNEYNLAVAIKNNCTKVAILPDIETRNDEVNLTQAGLAISTTKDYGKFPAIVYYSQKKVKLDYDKQQFLSNIQNSSKGSCISFDEEEKDIKLDSKNFKLVHKFGLHYLYKRV
jgi:hypothetical protein